MKRITFTEHAKERLKERNIPNPVGLELKYLRKEEKQFIKKMANSEYAYLKVKGLSIFSKRWFIYVFHVSKVDYLLITAYVFDNTNKEKDRLLTLIKPNVVFIATHVSSSHTVCKYKVISVNSGNRSGKYQLEAIKRTISGKPVEITKKDKFVNDDYFYNLGRNINILKFDSK